ncbi:MAG: alanine racemase [Thermoleophilia bacterium]
MSRRRAEARVDLAAIRHNAAVLAGAAGRARLMAVVKADAYGHGATPVARAALEGGAAALAVATVHEARELRDGGIEAPVLVMGPLVDDEWAEAAEAEAEVAAWTPQAIAAAAAAGAAAGRRPRVHLKLDTGMGRLGARPEDVAALADAAAAAEVEVVGVMTHFASADETEGPNAPFTREQTIRFRSAGAALRDRFPGAALHAANSAATLRDHAAAFDMVRCGIALYGCSPFGGDPADHDLRPAMSLVSYLAAVKTVRSRESVGYGRTWRAARGSNIGYVPVGYGDGYTRAFGGRATLLVAGRRVPVIGVVSMDQLAVDLGPEGAERVGDEVVLLGARGDERITAEELAELRGTINYEVVCNVGGRVPRVHA